jgi:hypothetical protein
MINHDRLLKSSYNLVEVSERLGVHPFDLFQSELVISIFPVDENPEFDEDCVISLNISINESAIDQLDLENFKGFNALSEIAKIGRWVPDFSNKLVTLISVFIKGKEYFVTDKIFKDKVDEFSQSVLIKEAHTDNPIYPTPNFCFYRVLKEDLKKFEQAEGIFDHGVNLNVDKNKRLSNIEKFNKERDKVLKAPAEDVKKRWRELKRLHPNWVSRSQFENKLSDEFNCSASTIRNRMKE